MKAIFELLSTFSFAFIFDWIIKLVKKYVLNSYIDLVDHVRSIFFIGLLSLIYLILLFCGFLFLHVAIFILLPISLSDKAIIILALGITYILISIFFLARLHSRSQWHKISGIKKMADYSANTKKE